MRCVVGGGEGGETGREGDHTFDWTRGGSQL